MDESYLREGLNGDVFLYFQLTVTAMKSISSFLLIDGIVIIKFFFKIVSQSFKNVSSHKASLFCDCHDRKQTIQGPEGRVDILV